MKKFKNISKIFLIVFILLISSRLVYAAGMPLSSGFFTEKGKKFYKAGDQSAAIHEFSKALQSDPSNQEARKYLEKMGIPSGIYDLTESSQVKLAKLAQEKKVYQDKLGDLEKAHQEELAKSNQLQTEKEKLCQTLQLKNDELDVLNIRANLLKNNLAESTQRYQRRLNQYHSTNKIKDEELEFLERMVHQHKYLVERKENQLVKKERTIDELDDKLALIKNISQQEIFKTEDERLKQRAECQQAITDLKKDIATLKKISERKDAQTTEQMENLQKAIQAKEVKLVELQDTLLKKDMELAFVSKGGLASDTQTMLSSSNEEVAEKIRLLKKQDEDIARLKEKLVDARRQISELEQKTKGAEESRQVEELKIQVEKIQEELNRKNLSLETQESDLSLLQDRLGDAQEQLTLVQSLVEEKESQIKVLEDEVKQIRQRCQ